MKSRVSTPEEVKLVITKIVETIKTDSQRCDKYSFDYTEDDLLDDYVSLKESCHCLTIETPYGYKIINVIDLSDDVETFAKTCETYIVFGEDKIYKHEGGYIIKEQTEEEFLLGEAVTNQIFLLECEVNKAKFFLLRNLDDEENIKPLIKAYKKAVDKLNNFIENRLNEKYGSI